MEQWNGTEQEYLQDTDSMPGGGGGGFTGSAPWEILVIPVHR